MSRIGILGGSFDPPHNAHIAMAQAAIDRIPLDKVLFMPAPRPPHKTHEALTPYAQRIQMVELAVAGHNGMELSLMEEFRQGPSYTVELLEHYHATHDDTLFLIVGADSAGDMQGWKDPARVLELATVVVFPRTGYDLVVPVQGDISVILFEDPVIDVSSTEIRSCVHKRDAVDALIPKSVNKFILDNSLYS
jgi:nicotinate-nucleotide adenylyltransferase